MDLKNKIRTIHIVRYTSIILALAPNRLTHPITHSSESGTRINYSCYTTCQYANTLTGSHTQHTRTRTHTHTLTYILLHAFKITHLSSFITFVHPSDEIK